MLRKDIMEFHIKDYLSDSDSPNLEFEFHTPELTELDQIEIIPPAGNPNELFLIEQEDTVDIAKYDPTEFPVKTVEFPFSPRGPPERTNFTGDYNFSVEVKAQDTHRKKYLYSHRLNRVYVDMEQNFSVQFVWDYSRLGTMYVRATTVFADQAQAEKRVERCVQHLHDLKNVNDFNENIVKHVLHSSREIGTLGVFYCGNASLPDSWYSVLVKFSPVGNSASCSHAYKFVCKSSCSTGINRRAIDVVFTLEDRNGHIYGRQTVGARVCSCPRRDMVRDEDIEMVALNGKKRMVPKPPAEVKSKKIKLEVTSNDEDAFTLPPIQIIGTKAAITGLEVMLSMMEQAASLKRGDQNAVEKYNNSIQSLETKIAEIKNGTKPASSCKTCGGPQ